MKDHEQSIKMKFCFKVRKSAKETHEVLKLVYGDSAVNMKTVYKWFERFRDGCESVGDEEGSGRPSTSKTQENVERVSEMIPPNGRLTIREIYESLNISYGSVQNILTTDLDMRRVSAKFVPRLFDGRAKAKATAFGSFIGSCTIVTLQIPSCLGNVVTGDETWVLWL